MSDADMALEQAYYDGGDFSDGEPIGFFYAHFSGGCRQRQSPQCKYCGSTEVFWHLNEANRWRMINLADYKPHICKEYRQKHPCTRTIKYASS